MGGIMSYFIEKIKQKFRKKAIAFQTGGIKPTLQKGESWIGKVCWQHSGEEQPLSNNGEPMIPLATIFVPESDYVPSALKNVKMINIFLDVEWLDCFSDRNKIKDFFVIRTYESLENIVPCDYSDKKQIRPFPLVPEYLDNEFPLWTSFNKEEYDLLASAGIDMDNYEDLMFEDNCVMHKLGGYPCFIQDGFPFEKGYEFVLQIYSDSKAGFNIVDDGNFYFAYNPEIKDWSVKCDFY